MAFMKRNVLVAKNKRQVQENNALNLLQKIYKQINRYYLSWTLLPGNITRINQLLFQFV